ncbi:winged helix-turn-helix domain-containing protein [Flavobacterium sp. 9AF]|uniref:winged helix-turn-helix domain-containing protein n=1 Tax=Flavobacterium sp. 9AF TaxID=2653142 RepID=UPI0013588787|nr:winged helix-turn-helix domain-containing protein [Flavobacterium sp. 9AF]
MNSISTNILKRILICGLFFCLISCTKESKEVTSTLVKVALRDVGHRLLLSNQDSISVIKPVIKLDNFEYQLSFEKQVTIQPDSLVALIKNSFLKANLPKNYLVEVLQCKDREVAYSYQMEQNIEKSIIPCGGRQLKKGCYHINVRFAKKIEKTNHNHSYVSFLFSFFFGVFGIILLVYFKRKAKVVPVEEDENYTIIGQYKFYPEQNKLIKETTEISLSKKECELLTIFMAQPNQIIKREELTKKVWEDHGVFVGRSLDTYISKLRIKLKEDTSIKLLNIHGVGYKLEID